MPTNDERRDVARKLRAIDYDALKESLICAFLDAIGETGYLDWVGVAHRLADLIEPEPERTCEDVSKEYGKFECSYCGCKITDTMCVDNGLVHFCPDCGRSVENAY